MSILTEQLKRNLPAGMTVPVEISALHRWIEANGFSTEQDGLRTGYLSAELISRRAWGADARPGGTLVEFCAMGVEPLRHWFGHGRSEVLQRLCIFAKTGSDGSMAAFWIEPSGQQQIVHLGSGSGSTLVCVLAKNALDFLRLLAVGYDEICWAEQFGETPQAVFERDGYIVRPNEPYRRWLVTTFGCTIPEKGSDIVAFPSEMDDADSPDPFWRWVEDVTA